jgi:hypothetical protein
MQVTKIEARVAQVLSGRQLVINRGHADGVTAGMRFAVMAESPVPILDPETNQVLDEIDRVKVRVEAIEVRERIAICSTYEYQDVALSIGELIGSRRKVPVTFQADQNGALPPLDPEESYVRRGDRVMQIVEPE